MLVAWCTLIGLGISVTLLTLGRDLRKPLPNWLMNLVKYLVKHFMRLIFKILRLEVKYEYVNTDYSYYLGPKWLSELKERKKPISTIVSNHTGVLDALVYTMSPWQPGQTPKEAARKIPGYGLVLAAFQSLFINREGGSEARDGQV